MKSNNKLTNALVSVEAAWICAAEVDMQQEEEERVELLARLRKQSVKGKYELASASTRLDQELLEQQLQWKKKTELRRLRQLPANERKITVNVVETSSNNNRKKCSVYAMENLRLAMLMKDTKLRQRVKSLEAEEEWHRAQRDKLQTRLNRKQLKQRVAQLEYGYYTKHEQIHDMESIYLDMQTQRMRVSPRAIEHGWVEEMEAKMKQQRALITKLKLEAIFELGLEFKRKEKELVEFQQRINAIEEKRRRFEIWRNEEYLDNWERECRFRYQAKIIQKRQQVAETRRRWQIQLYRTNGKSDHRWRGSHWSPDVLEAAKEKEVFCIGSTDILALVHDKWQLRMHEIEASEQIRDDIEMERDTREHIDDLTDQVALTAATAQIEQTKALFNPVFQDVDLSFDRIQMLQREHDRRLVATRQARKTRESDHVTTVGEVQPTECLVRRAEDPIHALDRQQRKRQLVLVAKVPWHLVDQLEVERRNLESEKATFKLWGKAYSRE
ncbi:hypothetical protein GQ600_11212 [Phytophthora cactorum]|nr:hypothetical protein GQ600_11212 [Phytophthora cactorum]